MKIARNVLVSVLRPYSKKPKTAQCLQHYGIKGMKWGVRRTQEELGHNKRIAENRKSDTIKTTISGHESSPKTSTPNSVMDHVDKEGRVDKRTVYDADGKKSKDIHTTDHGNPKQHPYGEHGEHAHDYSWDVNSGKSTITQRELTPEERKEHGDIL